MEALGTRETPRRSHAGFVLTGGRSFRMGQDKALLPWRDSTLVEHVAACVRAAASTVTLIGAPERYGHLGLATLADRYRDCGPLGGICTALQTTTADWNLIVACDMPGITADFLVDLLGAAESAECDCLLPVESGRHPLCAVYHRRAAAEAKCRVLRNELKMHDFVASLRTVEFPCAAAFVENINTPQDWTSR